MKLRIRVVLQLAALFWPHTASPTMTLTSTSCTAFRDDISNNLNPGFPVDVLIAGESCMPRGLTFANTSGPIIFRPEGLKCRSATPICWQLAPTPRSSTRN